MFSPVPLELKTSWEWIQIALTSPDAATTALGIVLLYLGAESLVRGASSASTDLGVRPAVAGVTVIAFATTAPELAIAVLSAVNYNETLGIGAIVGSNIANLGLVLGVSALIRPLAVSEETLRRHLPFAVLAAVLFVGLSLDGRLSRFDGGLFLIVLTGFTYVLLSSTGSDDPTDQQSESTDESSTEQSVATDGGATATTGGLDERLPIRLRDAAFLLGGLLLLLVGARRLISGGRGMLALLGASSRFIGVTVLALGTSLPELAASVVSAIRGEDDFSVGNVVGSNIYNILAVVGIAVLLAPTGVPATMTNTDLPFMLAVTALASVMLLTRRRVERLGGLVLLSAYSVYVSLLF